MEKYEQPPCTWKTSILRVEHYVKYASLQEWWFFVFLIKGHGGGETWKPRNSFLLISNINLDQAQTLLTNVYPCLLHPLGIPQDAILSICIRYGEWQSKFFSTLKRSPPQKEKSSERKKKPPCTAHAKACLGAFSSITGCCRYCQHKSQPERSVSHLGCSHVSVTSSPPRPNTWLNP